MNKGLNICFWFLLASLLALQNHCDGPFAKDAPYIAVWMKDMGGMEWGEGRLEQDTLDKAYKFGLDFNTPFVLFLNYFIIHFRKFLATH